MDLDYYCLLSIIKTSSCPPWNYSRLIQSLINQATLTGQFLLRNGNPSGDQCEFNPVINSMPTSLVEFHGS